MANKIMVGLLVVFLVVASYKLWQMEIFDQTHPFGTDTYKNSKYAKDLVGEDYGVNTFWGKPQKKDNLKKSIDRVQWLVTSCRTEVFWRKSLIFAILLGLFISIIAGENVVTEPSKLLGIISACYVALYMRRAYDNAHILKIQEKFVNKNIRKIKHDLGLKITNFIEDNKLI